MARKINFTDADLNEALDLLSQGSGKMDDFWSSVRNMRCDDISDIDSKISTLASVVRDCNNAILALQTRRTLQGQDELLRKLRQGDA